MKVHSLNHTLNPHTHRHAKNEAAHRRTNQAGLLAMMVPKPKVETAEQKIARIAAEKTARILVHAAIVGAGVVPSKIETLLG